MSLKRRKRNWNLVFDNFKPSFLKPTPNQLIMMLFGFYCPIFKRFYPKWNQNSRKRSFAS